MSSTQIPQRPYAACVRFVLSAIITFVLLCVAYAVKQYWAAIYVYVYVAAGAAALAGLTWAAYRVYLRYIDIQMRREELHAYKMRNQLVQESGLLLRSAYEQSDNVDIKYSSTGTVESLKIIRAHETQAAQTAAMIAHMRDQIEQISQSQQALQIEAPVQEDEQQIPQAPSFAEMNHLIQPDKLPLCWTTSGPAYGTILDLLSMAVTGKPGRGKTTALMYYVAMLLRAGAEVHVWDPHGVMGELARLNNQPLAGMPNTARVVYLDRKQDILASVSTLLQELDQRDQYYRPRRETKHPLLLLADELPVLSEWDADVAKSEPTMIELIKKFVLEARKWNCYFIGSGQSFDASILPTRVTENFNSRIVFFSSDRRARMSGLETDAIKNLLPVIRRAGPGIMIFDCSRWNEPMIGAIPDIDMQDMMRYLGVSERSRNVPNKQAVYPVGTITERAQEASGTHTESTERDSSLELKRLLNEIGKMKQNGLSNAAILKQFQLQPGGRNNVNLSTLISVVNEE